MQIHQEHYSVFHQGELVNFQELTAAANKEKTAKTREGKMKLIFSNMENLLFSLLPFLSNPPLTPLLLQVPHRQPKSPLII